MNEALFIKDGEIKINKTTSQPSSKYADGKQLSIFVENNSYEDVAYISFEDGIGLEKINHKNEDVPMIYVPVDDNDYAVAVLEENVKDIPIYFEAKTMGEYTISVSSKTKQFDNIYLLDNLTGEVTNMLLEDYKFVATTNDSPGRFVLKLYEYDSVDEINNSDDFVYVNNNDLIINKLTPDAMIQIFDVQGRDIMRIDNCVNNIERVSMDKFESGVYIIRKIDNKEVKTQKIIFHK